MQGLVVCEFSQPNLEEYLCYVKRLFPDGREPQVSQCDNGRYFVLLAGHRRLEALIRLREKFGKEWFYSSFYHQMGEEVHHGTIPVTMYSSLKPCEAVRIMLEENLQRSDVPLPTQAEAVQGMYELAVDRGERLTANDFASRYGMPVSFVANALRFCELPKLLRKAVEDGSFKWGCAIQLAIIARKLREFGWDSDRVNQSILELSCSEAAARTVGQFRSYLQRWVQEQVTRQGVLDGFFALTASEVSNRALSSALADHSTDFSTLLSKLRDQLCAGLLSKESALNLVSGRDVQVSLAAMLRVQRSLNALLFQALPCDVGVTELSQVTDHNVELLKSLATLDTASQ